MYQRMKEVMQEWEWSVSQGFLFLPINPVQAKTDDEVRWIQIDLGAVKKIDGIKLLPKVVPWGYVQSEGFPSRFRIEVSDDPDFSFACNVP